MSFMTRITMMSNQNRINHFQRSENISLGSHPGSTADGSRISATSHSSPKEGGILEEEEEPGPEPEKHEPEPESEKLSVRFSLCPPRRTMESTWQDTTSSRDPTVAEEKKRKKKCKKCRSTMSKRGIAIFVALFGIIIIISVTLAIVLPSESCTVPKSTPETKKLIRQHVARSSSSALLPVEEVRVIDGKLFFETPLGLGAEDAAWDGRDVVPRECLMLNETAEGRAAGIQILRNGSTMMGSVWPSTTVNYAYHPDEEDLRTKANSIIRQAMNYWEVHTCIKFVERQWEDLPDIHIKYKSTQNLQDLQNMILLITRYTCHDGKIGTNCQANIATPCLERPGNSDYGYQNCILRCAKGPPWRMPCYRGNVACIPEKKDVKCVANILTIGKACEKEGPTVHTLVHELGHALGLYHEMMRSDRDSFVEIYDFRIKKSQLGNFLIPLATPKTLGTPYDYLSIMHYHQYAFTKSYPNCITLRTMDPCAQTIIGRTKVASYYDIKFVNTLYKCNLHCGDQKLEEWMEKGYGSCTGSAEKNCYLDKDCECICPLKGDDDVRYLAKTHNVYQLLPSDCTSEAPSLSFLGFVIRAFTFPTWTLLTLRWV